MGRVASHGVQLMPPRGLRRRPAARTVGPRRYAAVMAKSPAALFQCSECGWRTMRWAGRCGDCQGWGTVAEVKVAPAAARPGSRSGSRAGAAAAAASAPAVPITEIDVSAAAARPTGLEELDRVLGGGLVPGAVVLLAGEPGVGKSTLLLEAGALAARDRPGAVRHRRGVGGPGKAAGQPGRRGQPEALPGRRDRPGRAARARRGRRARGC